MPLVDAPSTIFQLVCELPEYKSNAISSKELGVSAGNLAVAVRPDAGEFRGPLVYYAPLGIRPNALYVLDLSRNSKNTAWSQITLPESGMVTRVLAKFENEIWLVQSGKLYNYSGTTRSWKKVDSIGLAGPNVALGTQSGQRVFALRDRDVFELRVTDGAWQGLRRGPRAGSGAFLNVALAAAVDQRSLYTASQSSDGKTVWLYHFHSDLGQWSQFASAECSAPLTDFTLRVDPANRELHLLCSGEKFLRLFRLDDGAWARLEFDSAYSTQPDVRPDARLFDIGGVSGEHLVCADGQRLFYRTRVG